MDEYGYDALAHLETVCNSFHYVQVIDFQNLAANGKYLKKAQDIESLFVSGCINHNCTTFFCSQSD